MKKKSVYCIIVTYNAEKWIYNCIKSIREDNILLKILIIDNQSQDNTLSIVKENFPYVEIVQTGKNLGFGKANNLGYSIALKNNADYVYLLNQDTISYPDNIYNLILSGNKINDKVGVVSPLHLNDNGDKLDFLFEKSITSTTCKDYISDITLKNTKDFYKISFVNAAAWLINVDTIKDLGGLFSEAFFHYGEDLNFGSRLKYFGYSFYIIPSIMIHHCREERKGKKSKSFENKEVSINKITIMHDISGSFRNQYKQMLKYSFSELSKGNLTNFLDILIYPIFNYSKISNFRDSYINKQLK